MSSLNWLYLFGRFGEHILSLLSKILIILHKFIAMHIFIGYVQVDPGKSARISTCFSVGGGRQSLLLNALLTWRRCNAPHNGLLLHLLPQQAVGRSGQVAWMGSHWMQATALQRLSRNSRCIWWRGCSKRLPPTQLAGGSDRNGSEIGSSSGHSGSVDQFTLSLSLSLCVRCN